MKPTAMVLAILLALSGTGVSAHTVRHGSNVRAHPMHRNAAPSVHLHSKYPNGNSSGYGNRDVWGQRGGYYGPMITTGGGGR